ncbi:hypothetical protein ACLGI4_28575 [Streptomyces sp. HMX112]|uniref:hypothetical protein n=1 Tax=Streptomyces sp. HMX112 TaxID=3390850 RepID=UPI003A7F6C94
MTPTTCGPTARRGSLDEAHAELVDRHRELAAAETSVTFYRTLLHRLSAGGSR